MNLMAPDHIRVRYPLMMSNLFRNQQFTEYRFNMFYDAIHAVYPDITIISSLCINDDLPMGNCGPGSSLSNPPVGVATDLRK